MKIKSYTELIEMWPSHREFAEDIGVITVTGQLMHHRNSISPDHWEAVVAAAKLRGFDGVDLPLLMSLRKNRFRKVRRKVKRPSSRSAASSEVRAA